jgi:23S rRNA (adenine2030-N6)-methyltransferase
MVLIDPPFEIAGEYARMAAALADAQSRWAGGTVMIWHPLKDEEGYRAFLKSVGATNPAKSLIAELKVMPAEKDKLIGSALFIANPTFGLAEMLTEIMPFLVAHLAVREGASWAIKAHEGGRLTCDANG